MNDVSFRLSTANIARHIRVSNDPRYLSIGQVRERFGVSDMWVWRYMRRHGFPKPVKFGGRTSARHWRLSEIEQWERERAKHQGASSAPGFSQPSAAQKQAINLGTTANVTAAERSQLQS